MVQGNFIGTDVTGTLIRGNGVGVGIKQATGNIVGGTAPGAGNLISANTFEQIRLLSASGNVIQGNYLGTNAAGTAVVGRPGFTKDGVRLKQSSNNIIGGTAPGAGNVISGNKNGLRINERSTGNVVQGNRIGTDVTGTRALGNTVVGVVINNSPDNVIGGTAPGARNVISGNRAGLNIASSTVVQGNFIGTDVTGLVRLGNTNDGALVTGANTVVGGTAPRAGGSRPP